MEHTFEIRHPSNVGSSKVAKQPILPLDTDQILQRILSIEPNTLEYVEALISAGVALSGKDVAMALRVLRESCDVAAQLRNTALLARALTQHAWQLARNGKLDQALVRATHARAVADSIASVSLVCGAKYVMAWIRTWVGDYNTAAAMWSEMICAAQIINDRAREADYLSELGITQRRNNDSVAAATNLEQAYALYEAVDPGQLARCANNLAMTYVHSKQYAEAQLWLERAFLGCAADDNSLRAKIWHTAGLRHSDLDDSDAAQDAYDQSWLALSATTSDLRFMVELHIDCGYLDHALYNPPAAIEHFENATRIAASIESLDLCASAHGALQAINTSLGAFQRAIFHSNQQMVALESHTLKNTALKLGLLRAQDSLVPLRKRWARDVFALGYAN